MTCEEITALLTLAPLAESGGRDEDEPALSTDEATRLDDHITGCEACREVAAALTKAYAGLGEDTERRTTMEPTTTDLRERTLSAVRATLTHDAEPAQKKGPAAPEPGPDPRAVDAVGKKIALACSYCHDRATRDEVLFCASCLAPHHRECFETHGTCTLPGCGETRTVRPADAPSFAEPSSRRRRNWLALPMLIGVAGAGAVAALAARTGVKAFTPPTPIVAAPPSELTEPPPPPPGLMEVPDAPLEPTAPAPITKLEAGLMTDGAPPPLEVGKAIDIECEDVDLAEAMERIGRQVGRNILVDPTVQERLTVSLREIPWRDAVDVIARMCRCEVEERAGGILVLTQPPKVTIQFTDANLRTVLQLLAAYSGKNLILSPDVTGTLTVDLREMNWWRALEIVAENHGLQLLRCRDAVIVTKTPLDPAIVAQLPLEAPSAPARDPGPRLWLDAVNADLLDIGDRLGRLVGVTVIIDPTVQERVTLSLRDVPFRDALDAVARASSCRVDERPGGILYVTQPASASLDAADCPVKPWLQLLSAAQGWNAVIDGSLQGEVTVSLENIDLLDATALTLAPLGIVASASQRDRVFSFNAVRPVAPASPGVEVAPAEDARLTSLIADVARLARAAKRATDPAKRAVLATELDQRQAELHALCENTEPTAPGAGSVEVPGAGVRVQAILCVDASGTAVINGVVYGVGDSLLDAEGDPRDPELKVLKIERGAVTLREGFNVFTRSLGE